MEISPSYFIAFAGFVCGVGLGSVARGIRFCTFGAIEDAVLSGRMQRLKVWALAIVVAMLILQFYRLFEDGDRISSTFYLSSNLSVLGAIIGGLLFGFGMSLVGTCAYGSIVRLGGGDLRALIVALIIGLTAYMTVRGITGIFRVYVIEFYQIKLDKIDSQGIPEILSYFLSIKTDYLFLTCSLLFAIPVFFWCFKSRDQLRSIKDIIAGFLIGLFVALGFILTATIGNDPFYHHNVYSLAYARPIGESIIYLLTYSGTVINFSVATVFGTLFGAFVVAWSKNELRFEAYDDIQEMKRHLLGAFLMGFGAVTASGCTIGQGISGMATLSLNAPIALVSIFIGAVFGLYYLLSTSFYEAFVMLNDKIKSLRISLN